MMLTKHYESVGQLVQRVKLMECAIDANRDLARIIRGRTINGFDSLDIELAYVNPPTILVDRLAEFRNELVALMDVPPTTKRRRINYQERGAELDPDMVLRRCPNAWSDIRNYQQRQPRIVRIGINMATPVTATPEQAFWRGAAAAAAADILADRGCAVELVAFRALSDVLKHDRANELVTLQVKAPDMPMDLATLAISVAELAFYRFFFMAAGPLDAPAEYDTACGMPRNLDEHERAGFDFVVERNIMYRDSAIEAIHASILAVDP